MTPPPLDAADDARLRAFADLVRDSPHNLVSQRARDELWGRHIAESVALAAMLPGPGQVLDVGSGGGLPGMVIAERRPDLDVVLLDSSKKKTSFLVEAATALHIPVRVVRGRAEDVRDGPLRSSFDVVTARAVAPMDRLLGWTLPFLVPGGLLYAVKGRRWADEVAGSVAALRTWDGQVVATPDDLASEDVEASTPRPRVVVVRRGPGGQA